MTYEEMLNLKVGDRVEDCHYQVQKIKLALTLLIH
jgi:hypothetical protein